MTDDDVTRELLGDRAVLLAFLRDSPQQCVRLIRSAAMYPAMDDRDRLELEDAADIFRQDLEVHASWSGDRDIAIAKLAHEEHDARMADESPMRASEHASEHAS